MNRDVGRSRGEWHGGAFIQGGATGAAQPPDTDLHSMICDNDRSRLRHGGGTTPAAQPHDTDTHSMCGDNDRSRGGWLGGDGEWDANDQQAQWPSGGWGANDAWAGDERWSGGWVANDAWDGDGRMQQRESTAVAEVGRPAPQVDLSQFGPGIISWGARPDPAHVPPSAGCRDKRAPDYCGMPRAPNPNPQILPDLLPPGPVPDPAATDPGMLQTPLPQTQGLLGNQTAVAGAFGIDPNAAASRALSRDTFDLEYFRSLTITNHYSQHNVALKWHRQEAESAGRDCVIFNNDGYDPVARIEHHEGPGYHFVQVLGEGPQVPWRWQEMVAQMDDHSMRMVVEGLDGVNRSRGLVSCRLQQIEQYDHKRHHAAGVGMLMDMLHIWDFALTRDDGSQVFLHPSYSNTKIECYEGEYLDYEVPKSGMGGTSGRGTFKHFREKRVQHTLRFNARLGTFKRCGSKCKAKAKATSSSSERY
jgi:hypothetical protein